MVALPTILRLNAASCIAFGLLFIVMPGAVVRFLSESPAPSWVFLIIGIGLILNGAALMWTSFKPMPSRSEILFFSAGDFAWVVATVGLIIAQLWVTTVPGTAAALVIAVIVGGFGALQMKQHKKMGNC